MFALVHTISEQTQPIMTNLHENKSGYTMYKPSHNPASGGLLTPPARVLRLIKITKSPRQKRIYI